MSRYRAIPEGYFTVGELAKRMGTTVRTLQYYDRQGLLAPSAESEGGRRLYTDRDMVRLHQIMSLKTLGFSLEDIKNRLISLNTPEEFAAALTEQAAVIREQRKKLSQALEAIEKLREEALQMKTTDFRKYADILVNLRMKNEYYWMIKHMDEKALSHFRNHFDEGTGMKMMETFSRLMDEACRLREEGTAPESAQGQSFAGAFWRMIMEFTGGDMTILPGLMAASGAQGPSSEQNRKLEAGCEYLEAALDVYFTALGYDPTVFCGDSSKTSGEDAHLAESD